MVRWGFIVLFAATSCLAQSQKDDIARLAKDIEWHGQSSVRIPLGSAVVYVDPFNIKSNNNADIVLITHSHKDHLSPNNLARVARENTLIIAPLNCESILKENGYNNLMLVHPGDSFSINNVTIKAVPAYNVVKTNFHSKDKKWVGYLISSNGITIYHPGDTERIPEMKTFKCDIAFMPLGQTYTMNSVKEAAMAVSDVGASIAIPFHYGMYEGKESDAELFKSLVREDIKVVIKPFPGE